MQDEGAANDMQINENKGINEWPKPVEVGTAFAICHFAIVRRPSTVAFPGIANEPHNFCRLHFAAKAPEKAAPVPPFSQFPAPPGSSDGSCFNEV